MRGHPERLGAQRPEVRLGLGAGLGLATRHHHAGARRGEALGESATDAAGSPGHHGHAIGQVEERAELVAIQRVSSRIRIRVP